MAVIAVGDIDVAATEARIKTLFSDLKNPDNQKARPDYTIPDHQELRVKVVEDPEATSTSIDLLHRRPLPVEKKEDDYRTRITRTLYINMLNHRLYEASRTPDSPFLGAWSYREDFLANDYLQVLSVAPKENHISAAIQGLILENRRVQTYGFTEPELKRAKHWLMSIVESAYKERDKVTSGELIHDYMDHYLAGRSAPGMAWKYQYIKNEMPALTLADIKQAGEDLEASFNSMILVTSPKEIKVPTETEIISLVSQAGTVAVLPYKDEITDQPLLPDSQLAPPGRVVSETRDARLGLTAWTLSNGITVTLKPTDFKNDEVILMGYRYGGTSLAPLAIYPSATHASTIVTEGGLNGFSKVALSKLLSGNTASVSVSIDDLAEEISGGATPKDIKTLFELVYLTFTAPRKDKDSFVYFMNSLREQYQHIWNNPETRLHDLVMRTMSQNHPRGPRFLTEQDIDQINLGGCRTLS